MEMKQPEPMLGKLSKPNSEWWKGSLRVRGLAEGHINVALSLPIN